MNTSLSWFNRAIKENVLDFYMEERFFMKLRRKRAKQSESSSQTHGGSHPRRAPNIDRDFQAGHQRIYDDYFAANCV